MISSKSPRETTALSAALSDVWQKGELIAHAAHLRQSGVWSKLNPQSLPAIGNGVWWEEEVEKKAYQSHNKLENDSNVTA